MACPYMRHDVPLRDGDLFAIYAGSILYRSPVCVANCTISPLTATAIGGLSLARVTLGCALGQGLTSFAVAPFSLSIVTGETVLPS